MHARASYLTLSAVGPLLTTRVTTRSNSRRYLCVCYSILSGMHMFYGQTLLQSYSSFGIKAPTIVDKTPSASIRSSSHPSDFSLTAFDL